MSAEKTRDPGPDFIKGVAITLMVYGHISFAGTLAGEQKALVNLIYVFHMPLFLLISGYYFSPAEKGREMLGRVMRRIVVPYLLFHAVYLILLYGAQRQGFQTNTVVADFTPGGFLSTLLLHPVGGYWFLHTLIIYQVCLLAAFALFPDPVRAILAFVGMIVLLVQWGHVTFSYANAGFLLFGYLLRRTRLALPKEGWVAAAVLLVLLLSFGVGQLREDYPVRFAFVLAVFALLMALASVVPLRLPVALFRFLGLNSLLILVFHAFALNAVKLVQRPIVRVDPTGITYIGVILVVTMVLCLGAGWVMDRLGLSKWVFGMPESFQRFATVHPAPGK